MTAFVEHFVDADIEEWSIFLAGAPKDGPGFINSLAHWCAAMSDGQKRDVKCEPNMWNMVAGMSKILKGTPLSYAESVAMNEGGETPEALKLTTILYDAFQDKREGEATAFKRRLENWVDPNLNALDLELDQPDQGNSEDVPKGLKDGPA